MTVTEATFELSVPPSVNKLYANVRGIGRVKTAEYKAWTKATMLELIAQKAKPVTPPVALWLYLPESMNGDASNRIKAVEDALVKAGIIADDNKRIVRSVSITFHDGPRMKVCVKSLASEAA